MGGGSDHGAIVGAESGARDDDGYGGASRHLGAEVGVGGYASAEEDALDPMALYRVEGTAHHAVHDGFLECVGDFGYLLGAG